VPSSAPSPEQARALVLAKAEALGFATAGVARADEPLEPEHDRYLAALEAGLHGPLGYLAENVEARRRLDHGDVLVGARSVIVATVRYEHPAEPTGEPRPTLAAGIARYARGRDYHNRIRKALRQLAAYVRTLGEGVEARPMIDTAPVLERAWAARAGVGFLGKHGLIITPGQGSWTLIGEVVTTLAITPDAKVAERCGQCTACLDACPTGALVRPFVLDAGRCISTWTIEVPTLAPEPLRAPVAEHLFGCDVCQEVCPHNARPRPPGRFASTFAPHPRWETLRLVDLARLGLADGPRWEEIAEGTPVHRAGPEGLARNACLALATAREDEPEADEVLRRVAEQHPSEVVREAASWALARRSR
jgi:epoxyqueuosine reductase